VQALLQQYAGNSAAARAQIERTFEHSSKSGRQVLVKKTGNEVYVEGQVQKGTSAGHKGRMVQVAAHALEEEDTVAVFVDRPLSEALEWIQRQKQKLLETLERGSSRAVAIENEIAEIQTTITKLKVSNPTDLSLGQLELAKFGGPYPVKEPDVVRIWTVGKGKNLQYRIDITEVVSQGQTGPGLTARIGKTYELLPANMVGEPKALPPQ
jgi:hypothetical protein